MNARHPAANEPSVTAADRSAMSAAAQNIKDCLEQLVCPTLKDCDHDAAYLAVRALEDAAAALAVAAEG